MTSFDEIFNEMDVFYKKLMKKLFKEIDELEKTINGQGIDREWKIRPTKATHAENYLQEGRTGLTEIPELPQVPRYITEETFEPLIDIIEERNQIRVYMELPSVNKNEIQLTISEDYAEIKAKSFHKWVKLPTKRLDAERAAATYRNGVLKVTIPKARFLFHRSGKSRRIKMT
jgi:HSP20 family molecular chaperone IbpA